MHRQARERGVAPLIAVACTMVLAGAWLAVEAARFASAARRDAVTERVLAQAREALLAYAADRPIGAEVGPGYLPCPDADGDGWAEAICGSLSGDRGQAERLGRLPWKTLGLADLRDGYGEGLWYAVATKYKGLLNCAASPACVDMTPGAALGTITVRDALGAVTHDGTLRDASRPGAVALVIAPGPPLERLAGGRAALQRRGCAVDECDAAGRCLTVPPRRAARCDPRNYLDAGAGEDNADFSDRLDAAARESNTDGFIRGPVRGPDGAPRVNDRIAVVAAADVMPRVMRRVGLEVAACLRFYASRPENGGRYPWPDAACGEASPPAYGRAPSTPFEATVASAGGTMLPRWWRAAPRMPERLAELPTAAQACRIAVAPTDDGTSRTLPPGSPPEEGTSAGTAAPAWWSSWRWHVLYAPAAGYAPAAASPGCVGNACLQLLAGDGSGLARDRQFAIVVTRSRGACSSPLLSCDATRCTAVRLAAVPSGDVALAPH